MTNPKDCPHKFVRLVEKWHGQGKYIRFQCNECDAYLIPQWTIVDALGNPIETKESE